MDKFRLISKYDPRAFEGPLVFTYILAKSQLSSDLGSV